MYMQRQCPLPVRRCTNEERHSADIRARVMECSGRGMQPSEIASRLMVSTKTIRRYRRAAEVQHLRVPRPKPRGGYRRSLAVLNRDQIVGLGQLLMQLPKLSIRDLRQTAIERGVLDADKVVSCSTVARAIKKLDLTWKRATFVDPKGIIDRERPANADDAVNQTERESDRQAQLLADERVAFRLLQRQGRDGQLNPYDLLFMDETNCRLYDQQHYAWTRANKRAILFRPKGQSPTFNVIATMGIDKDSPGQMFLHYVIVPPRRDYRGVPKIFKAYEFRHPKAGIDFGYSLAQINELPAPQLERLMLDLQLRLPPGVGLQSSSDARPRCASC